MPKMLVTLSFVVDIDTRYSNTYAFPLNCTQDYLEYMLHNDTTIEIRDSNAPRDEHNCSPSILIHDPLVAVEELRDSYHYSWNNN